MGQFAYLECSVGPGMFNSEYEILLDLEGRKIAAVVGKETVELTRPPVEGRPGAGWLRVRILDLAGDIALVDLPRPAFTSEPRLKVPRKILRMAA